MIRFEEFCGGVLDTNAFLLRGPAGNVLIDAPQGADQHFATESIHALLLTHGHFDHVADAAAIQRRHGCRVYFHPETLPMVTDPNFFRDWGFALEVEPIEAAGGEFLTAASHLAVGGLDFEVLEVPGHCPGSLCFYLPTDGALFGGDVLFRGGIGRWDLPGGDHDLLVTGIRGKILPLPDRTRVFPGHGPVTTVVHERTTNSWLGA
jgi:glyoxylase-like metal-dependent hydrolase (beta-lactamase superfamily II)